MVLCVWCLTPGEMWFKSGSNHVRLNFTSYTRYVQYLVVNFLLHVTTSWFKSFIFSLCMFVYIYVEHWPLSSASTTWSAQLSHNTEVLSVRDDVASRSSSSLAERERYLTSFSRSADPRCSLIPKLSGSCRQCLPPVLTRTDCIPFRRHLPSPCILWNLNPCFDISIKNTRNIKFRLSAGLATRRQYLH